MSFDWFGAAALCHQRNIQSKRPRTATTLSTDQTLVSVAERLVVCINIEVLTFARMNYKSSNKHSFLDQDTIQI